MKIIIPMGLNQDSKVLGGYIDLCGQGRPEGSAEGLFKLKLTNSLAVNARLSVTSATSTSKKGVRSAVIKVSVPYVALTRDENNAIIIDPKRSMGEVSMHVVVNLPANAAQDLRNVNQSEIRNSAYGQLTIVSQILRALLSRGIMEHGSISASGDIDHTMAVGSIGSTYGEETSFAIAKPEAPDGPGTPVTWSIAHISAETVAGDLGHFATRVANGLPPLGCGDVNGSVNYRL